MNNDDFYEELAKDFPHLMEKSQTGIHVDKGWWSILRELFAAIYQKVDTAEGRLRASIQYPRDDNGDYERECREKLKIVVDELPEITDIKEKYGTLRVYVHNSNETVDALISFAEGMSGVTCEACGKPGFTDGEGWVKTYCMDHHPPEVTGVRRNGKTPAAPLSE